MNERFELISRTPSKFYLAYGSNLDMERMGRRCPYAVPVGVTEIYGYRLLFKKSKTGSYATIEQDANESVRPWFGNSQNMMNFCWTGTRASHGTTTKSSSSFPSGT